jgi:HEAT repeat protein
LESFGTPAVDYLHKALYDDDKCVRYRAAYALGNISYVRSIVPLVKLLDDNDQYGFPEIFFFDTVSGSTLLSRSWTSLLSCYADLEEVLIWGRIRKVELG